MIVYLNGATPRRRMPGIGWLKKCYQMIDRRWVGWGPPPARGAGALSRPQGQLLPRVTPVRVGPAAGGRWPSLACRRSTSVSAGVATWQLPVRVRVPFPFLRTPLILHWGRTLLQATSP